MDVGGLVGAMIQRDANEVRCPNDKPAWALLATTAPLVTSVENPLNRGSLPTGQRSESLDLTTAVDIVSIPIIASHPLAQGQVGTQELGLVAALSTATLTVIRYSVEID